MREEYDFSNSIKNPYAQKEKKQISINIFISENFNSLIKVMCLPRKSAVILDTY